MHIGLLCVQQDPDDRPTMSDVVVLLGSESMALPQPRQPLRLELGLFGQLKGQHFHLHFNCNVARGKQNSSSYPSMKLDSL